MREWGLWVLIGMVTVFFASTTLFAYQLNEQKQYNQKLVVQNVQQTKQDRAAISDAYKAGLIACGNEDIQFLNDTAYEYRDTLFARILRSWARTWAYDEDRLREMVEDYMSGEVY